MLKNNQSSCWLQAPQIVQQRAETYWIPGLFWEALPGCAVCQHAGHSPGCPC